MRQKNKLRFFIAIATVSMVLIIFWEQLPFYNTYSKNSDLTKLNEVSPVNEHYQNNKLIAENMSKKAKLNSRPDILQIMCDINHGDKEVACLQYKSEVYVPFFGFLKNYFELYGEIEEKESRSSDQEISMTNHDSSLSVFHWRHSYSQAFKPHAGVYSFRSSFMSFEHYNVENRDRVLLISAKNGVPLSTQWSKNGYHYPIQIAQFGLSHYSKKVLQEAAEKDKSTDNDVSFVGEDISDWILPSFATLKLLDLKTNAATVNRRPVWYFNLADNVSKGIRLPLNPDDLVPAQFENLLFELRSDHPVNISVTIQLKVVPFGLLRVHYCTGCTSLASASGARRFQQIRVSPDRKDIYYSIGDDLYGWRRFARHLPTDIRKALTMQSGSSAAKRRQLRQRLLVESDANGLQVALRRVQWISLRGQGEIGGLRFARSAHLWHCLDAAEWLLENQWRTKNGSQFGAWPVPVPRRLMDGPAMLRLAAGWSSGMAQGQAMSLLVRTWALTGRAEFLYAAVLAVHPLNLGVAQGGVRANFLDQANLPWYEEYPTQPGLFVLNGFMYALFGLYDLQQALSSNSTVDVSKSDVLLTTRLLHEGMATLRKLLPLFDTGSGSYYDLRHISLASKSIVSPRLARWDYHATHVTQLWLLAKLDPSTRLWWVTAQRWETYFKGHRVQHN